MRIFLDAYFDNNFGDDLFIDLLLKRYPDVLFYTFWKETPQSVIDRAARFSNLVILPGGCVMQTGWNYDAYVMIGGDVLPDGVNYSDRICHMRHVKECGGFVAMLGFSLYKDYGEKTIADLKAMAKIADTIVIRDKISAQRFKELVPEAQVIEATDMVFTAGYGTKTCVKDNVLGIIPRRKLYSTEEEYKAYCRGMATIADAYVEKDTDAGVRFLAYSTGEYDDRVTAADIIRLMRNSSKTEVISYEGDISQFLQKIQSCIALVTTRFHGLVFALIFRIPFVPVPYEVKVTQLLSELSYEGIQIPYGEDVSLEQIRLVLTQLQKFGIAEGNLSAYEQKSQRFFTALDKWKYSYKEAVAGAMCVEKMCSANAEKVQLQMENHMLRQQQTELEKWIKALQQERKVFERQNLELESIRQWQKEKLDALIQDQETFMEEYNTFIQTLGEKLDNQIGL